MIRLLAALAHCTAVAFAADVQVRDAAGFRAAVAAAKPGDRLLLAGGNYTGGFHFSNLRGAPGQPILIAAADPKNPPVFRDGNTGLHLSRPAYLELRGLTFTRLAHNGLNLDDGNAFEGGMGATEIVLRSLHISDIGSDGNHDGIKLSGLAGFRVEDCMIERWGTKGGSAIDMVGCHRGVIAGNTLRHIDPAPPNCTAVQCKGGTSDIAIHGNRFENAGGRGVNVGGSTGLPYFRPALTSEGERVEARNIRVEGNTFVGGVTAVAFAGADGGVFRFNTIERPGRWALRILQENRTPGFVPSRNGVISDNLIVFDSAHWAEGGVNIGAGTAPETFSFARNWWYCTDRPERSTPKLPTAEKDGVYGKDPADAADKVGAKAWRK